MRDAFGSAALTLLLAATQAQEVSAIQDQINPLESTTAFQLLTLERSVRQLPPDAEDLFRAAIEDATAAALRINRHPKTKDEAKAVLGAIQLALVKHNFLQPPEEKDWPQTLGMAFVPRTFTPEALEIILATGSNHRRAEYIDRDKPMYFVDCDMGSQLFLAVGERLAWDIRLVEVPRHNFVRWHLSEATRVNWDWVSWESEDDTSYRFRIPSQDDPRLRSLYLRSLESREARAYYLGLIGSEALLPADGERLLKEALEVLPNHPLTLNNLAWLYATTPEFSRQHSGLAVSYSLAALSTRPYDGNYADTVACAFAADYQTSLAEKMEEFAMDHATSPSQREGFGANRALIYQGKLCNP